MQQLFIKTISKRNYGIPLQIYQQKKNYKTKPELATGYKPRDVENRWILSSSTSSLGNNNKNEKYSLILPPPNVTGKLHLGHALMCTLQDCIVRWKRDQQFRDVCWVPGMDHAGIATQVVVEKKLSKDFGINRHDIGRTEFLKKVWQWTDVNRKNIKNNLQKLGITVNWEREYFTMDNKHSEGVIEAFIRLFENNLIYRDSILVNWSCSLESTISDIEIDNLELLGVTPLVVPGYDKPIKFGQITNISYGFVKYPTSSIVKTVENDEIIVSTTRPETILGDVAVAVNPNDNRYAHLKNTISPPMLWHPFRNEYIPLIFDNSVEPEFGTGAVKITPAHDRFDFELAKRHNLSVDCKVIDEKGLICMGYNEFSNKPRFIARELIKNELANLGKLRETKSHKMLLPICSRSKDIIELLLKPQWFVKSSELTKNAIDAVQCGKIKLYPNNFKQDWKRWLSESRDWCISRQLWWGHQIPAYKCKINNKKNNINIWIAAKSINEAEKKFKIKLKQIGVEFNENNNNIEIIQDNDVLDTWFSSALLPFTVFGWPNINHSDYKRYYPQDLLETGHDILFFWVARMVMLGQYLTGEVPFKNVLLHGVICDSNGRKMSKSLGNIILPDQIIYGVSLEDIHQETKRAFDSGILSIEEYHKSIADQSKQFPNGIPECGTDALRFTLCSYNIKSHFINFDANECYTNKLFFNKIWQSVRFTSGAYDKFSITQTVDDKILPLNEFTDMDRWILSRLGQTIKTVDQAMETYDFHIVTQTIKSFFYQNFCDVYLETTKPNFNEKNQLINGHCKVLAICLSLGLNKLKHITPFVCSELLQHVPVVGNQENLNKLSFTWINNDLEYNIDQVLSLCFSIRQIKSENLILKKNNPIVHLFISNIEYYNICKKNLVTIKALTQSNEIKLNLIDENNVKQLNKINFVVKSTAGPFCWFGIEQEYQINENISNGKKKSINEKKLEKLQIELDKLLLTVSNGGYKKSADPKIQQKHKERIVKIQLELKKITDFS